MTADGFIVLSSALGAFTKSSGSSNYPSNYSITLHALYNVVWYGNWMPLQPVCRTSCPAVQYVEDNIATPQKQHPLFWINENHLSARIISATQMQNKIKPNFYSSVWHHVALKMHSKAILILSGGLSSKVLTTKWLAMSLSWDCSLDSIIINN